nr:type VII secretion target [uncultured Actinoplanes sp.]
MPDSFQVDAAQLHRHASNVRSLRDQLMAVQDAGRAIARDDAAYGVLCGWISAALERRHVRQAELYAYLDENLQLAADALTATGDDYDATDSAAQGRLRAAGGLG